MMKIDMSKFIGSGFDCEFTNGNFRGHSFAPLAEVLNVKSGGKYKPTSENGQRWKYVHCRPRLNKPQVCDSWDWVPDGFVWDVLFFHKETHPVKLIQKVITSDELSTMPGWIVVWASCIGLEQGYELEGMGPADNKTLTTQRRKS
jgi:hypothetical protein